MTPLLFLAIAVAGGVGSSCRLVLEGVIRSRRNSRLPWGTIVLNVSGSFLLGLVTGLVIGTALPEAVRLVIGTGFLGGYTTFSTASFDTVRLLQERRWLPAAANGLGVLTVATGIAGFGLWLGAWFGALT